MITVGEHTATAAADAIHRESDSRADRHHPAPERILIIRFDNEVRVVALQGVLHEPKASALAAAAEAALDPAHDANVTKRRQIRQHANRDVRGHRLLERLPRDVAHPPPFAPLPSRAGPTSSPARRRGQGQFQLFGSS
jgi:hypothetical protein